MALLPRPPSLSARRSSLLGDGQALASCCPKPRTDRFSDGRRIPSICRASWGELVGVLVFSAIPFAAVKAVANSSVGEELRRRLEGTKRTNVEKSSRFKALSERAREASLWYGKHRPRWLGPLPYEYPTYLTGEFPGDYGFDIANLSEDRKAFEKYFNFEILHARWAMLASLGVLVPEGLDQLGVVHFVEPVWWKVGYAKLKGDTLDYLGIPGFHIAGSQGIIVIAICQALLMHGHSWGCGSPGWTGVCQILWNRSPGAPWHLPAWRHKLPRRPPLRSSGISKDPAAFEELKVKEIKNGRLAMVSWLGFAFQAALTGKGPIQNLVEHLAEPFHNNVLSLLSHS
ncbi:unnamed protein product [Spirodela intermedia]|uniref:Chlorophyll a-b binding protein, chloroplastic n=1 Tax=Spirodela intermedia TaxID=51605 RepID=A0A7I8JQ42_SPIIN|nr:unnamed protein product [Spirodela intermedia]CAA6672298.1 unnamed protein product [Spirodela intermedia]